MELVLTANKDKANELNEIKIDLCFNAADEIEVNEESKKLVKLLPFIYTLEQWKESMLNAFDVIKCPKIEFVENGKMERGIQPTDAECRDYQKLKPNDIIEIFMDGIYNEVVQKWFNYLNTWYDIQENEASSFLLMSALNPYEKMIFKICKWYRVEDMDIKNRLKIFKYVHTTIRLTGCDPFGEYLDQSQYLNLQYLQDLCNRRVYIRINDVDELMNDLGLRIEPPPGFRWLYYNELMQLCGDAIFFEQELFKTQLELFDIICKDIKSTELIDFNTAWATRSNSMPSGAATGYKYRDQPLDKRAAHELGLIDKEEVLNAKTIVSATASMKYENGKCRYLYSTDVLDQIRTDYILALVDKHMHALKQSGMGLNQTQELQQELDLSAAVHEREKCFSFDYEDYNNQHTFDYMKNFWLALQKAMYKQFGAICNDYLTMIDIKIKTIGNRFIGKLGNDGIIAKSVDTLLSGSRETATLNTFNNIAYSKTIERNVTELLDKEILLLLKAVGDDQTGKAVSQKMAIYHVLFMMVAGCEGSKNKILLGIEFLRKMYWVDGSINGYLNRSIANLISRDQNRTERVDKHTIPISLMTQLRKVYSRNGGRISLDRFYNWNIDNKCIFVKDNKIVKLPYELIHARKENGGLGILPFSGKFEKYQIKNASGIPRLMVADVPKVDKGMSVDLLLHLQKTYKIPIANQHVLLDNMRQKNLINIASAEDKKLWYEKINIYISSLKIEPIDIIEEPLYTSLGKKVYTEILAYLTGDKNVKHYYNPIDVITSIISKTEIKNYDIFSNLVDSIQDEFKINEVQAIQKILKQYLGNSDLLNIITQAVNRCGMEIILKILSNDIQYNSILEGYIRDTILVFIRSFVINYFIEDNQLNQKINKNINELIRMMGDVELFILNDSMQGGIWKYIRP